MNALDSMKIVAGRRSFRGGFSLIELVAVMTIGATLAVVALINAGSLVQSRQRAAAVLLFRDLNHARTIALQSGTPTWFDVLPASGRIEYRSGTTRSSATPITNPATGGSLISQLGASSDGGAFVGTGIGTVNGSSATWQGGFDYLSRPVDASGAPLSSPVTITVTSPGYSNCTITVQPESGDVVLVTPAS